MGQMRLDSVEIAGFKSFCDKQELSFKGGITGVVGPNGCGKSNISDAINWVLGEQSAKSLRGTSMEDVIFNGSAARQPLQMAEVNLKVSGLNGNSPDGAPECVVSRRLYRNGESEYLMNGAVCRLRDIHELFMDTGLGSKAYSIIEQGKIGLILSSKPADRRALIEEAAGITKYKARRRQTHLKLEAAQQNLLRVNDIVHEVEKQLESLKRQAGKARRYRVLREEMQGVERIVYARRFLDLETVPRGAQGAPRRGRAARAVGARGPGDGRGPDGGAAHRPLRRRDAPRGGPRTDGRAHPGRGPAPGQGGLRQAADRGDRRPRRRGPAGSRGADRAGGSPRHRPRGAPRRRGFAARRAPGRRRGVEGCRGSARREHHSTGRRRAAPGAARDAQVGLMGRIATFQNARASVSGSAERAQADLLKLAAEWDELQRERAAAREGREAAEAKRLAALESLKSLGLERDAARAQASEARLRAEALAREAETLQSEVSSLVGRLASLEEMVKTHSAFDEGVRALLDRPESLDVLGVVADALETDKTHERAVEAFIGDRLQAILVPDAAQALRGIRYLQESGAGRGAFLPLAQARTKADCGPLREIAAHDPKVKGLLSDYFRVTGPHAERIKASLPDALVVESLEDALDVTFRQGPVPCVTLAGETARGAMIEGGRGVKGLLAPRREAREVAERHVVAEAQLQIARGRVAEESAAAQAAEAEARGLEERIHVIDKDLVAIQHDLGVAAEADQRLDRKAAVLETERSQAEQEKGAAAVKLAEVEHALGQAEAERATAHDMLLALATALTDARAASEAAQARSSEAKSRLAALRERVAAAEADVKRLESEHEELVARIAGAEGRREEMGRRREQLQTELAEGEALLAEALSGRDRVTGEVAVAEERVRELRSELESREQALKERRREREMLKDALSELEVGRARAESDLDHLARECHQAVGQTAAEAAATLTDEDKAREMSALEAQVLELRERIERMGQVNVLAVEQAQEFEERHTFLVAQRQDLLDSISELDRAIKTIDKASRERFQEAFQVINERFGEVFRQLFGGGTAGLSSSTRRTCSRAASTSWPSLRASACRT